MDREFIIDTSRYNNNSEEEIMPKTIQEYKNQEVSGFDVWLDSGVCIRGFKEFDEKAIKQAKKQIIDMIKKDECSWYWEEYRGDEL